MEEIKSDGKETLTIGQHFAELRKHSFLSFSDGSKPLRAGRPDPLKAKDKALLEDSLYRVSMGEYTYNPKYDDRYQHWPALFRHCRAWETAHADGPYVEYKTEADCMTWGMQRLGTINKVAAPIPWLAAIKRLRAAQKAQTCAQT
jgi:hypothetical protein